MLYDISATKRATNLSLNSDLIKKAKQLKLNISNICEKALEEQLKKHDEELWLAENKEAMTSYNEFVEENGLFSDSVRRF